MSVVESERPRDAIVRLSHRGLGVREFSLAAARALRRSIPFAFACRSPTPTGSRRVSAR
jgi:hypothetical protein